MVLGALEKIKTEERLIADFMAKDMLEYFKYLTDALGVTIANHLIATIPMKKGTKQSDYFITSMFKGSKETEEKKADNIEIIPDGKGGTIKVIW